MCPRTKILGRARAKRPQQNRRLRVIFTRSSSNRQKQIQIELHLPSSQSEYTFRSQLKPFKKSFPDIIIWYWLHPDFSLFCLFQLWDDSAVTGLRYDMIWWYTDRYRELVMVELTYTSCTVERRSISGSALTDIRAWSVDTMTVSTDTANSATFVDIWHVHTMQSLDHTFTLWVDYNLLTSDRFLGYIYTGWTKKVSLIIFAITLSTASQFS